MPPAPPPTSPVPAPGRRQVVRALTGFGLLGALTGCGIRLEDDAPKLPFVPTRTPLPAEPTVLALLAQTRALATLTRTWADGAALAGQLSAIHDDQADVLAAALRAEGVPDSALSGTSATSSPGHSAGASTRPTASPTPTAATKASVVAEESAALADGPALSGADAALRPILAALLAQRAAAVGVLTGKRAHLGRPATPTWASGAAAPLLAATRSARYGFEVVSAQGDRATSRSATAALTVLAALEREQQRALGAPGPDPAGYLLPFPVRTPAAAARLGGRLATGLLAAYGTVLTPTNPAIGPATMLEVVDWLAQAQVLAHGWKAPLAAFPGMSQRS